MDDFKPKDNVISTCWVIETKDMGPSPYIYLHKPTQMLHPTERVTEFMDVFSAKKYINWFYPGARVEIDSFNDAKAS